ncbi:hypothetical protein J1N35_045305 [Gossypium stocksii]|uniref:Reverse transcriptase n=1 Tax=Gossypium stocksii TaxID=47602 RepID=A0A9D3UAR3_9ROSI|nr:hypothetical protein J1N35_045305 [Gossypium stocksii]
MDGPTSERSTSLLKNAWDKLGHLYDVEEKYLALRARVIYKIVSKTLANQLKDVLSLYISQNQSAFVPNWMIHDNVLVAHVLMHYLRSSKNGPNKGCVVKLDMGNTYNRVEWSFLEKNKQSEVEAFTKILETFERMSGKSINLEKSMFYFSPNTPVSQRATLSSLLKMKVVTNLDDYLGLPIPIGKKKSAAFQSILDRTANKINSWLKRLLSNGRQVWRLINYKGTLCFKVLSIKYFPEGDVLHRKQIDKSSFTWQIIAKSASLLYEGFDWNMGIGSKIEIWHDN